MIFDLAEAQVTGAEFPEADVCVVGAGAAGIVLAVELQRYGKRVLLLESGGRSAEDQDPYRAEIIGLRYNGVHSGRFRVYGGSTTQWGGQILELDEIDFAKRPWVPGSGWPFPKSVLTPHYLRALQLEGLENTIRDDVEVWKAIGQRTPELGPLLLPYFSRWCPEPDFTRLHGRTLDKSENIAVYLHAHASGIILDEQGDGVAGVRCQTHGGKTVLFRARQFVVCLGGIETSRFLLQPIETRSSAFQAPPWNHGGMVGKHFQDHIDCFGAEVVDIDQHRFHGFFDNVFTHGYKFHPKLKLSPDKQREESCLNVAGMMVFQSDADQAMNRMKLIAKRVVRGRFGEIKPDDPLFIVSNLPLFLQQMYRYKVQHRMFNGRANRILLRVHCEQEPLSASSISLSEERDRFGMFRARLDWRVSRLELDTIRKYVDTVRSEFAQRKLARIVPDADLFGDESRFLEKVDDSYHHMGGTRMSSSPQDGVVDPDLKLHAIRNCYICSSSVFPNSGFSNPTHTLLALAVRVAQHLADHTGMSSVQSEPQVD